MNETQMEQIIQVWGKDILRFCRITAGSKDEGNELYQDTMLKLLEKQELLDDSQNIKSYALSVAIKLWKNKTRKFARRLRLVPQESLEEVTALGIHPAKAVSSPEELLMQKAQVRMVRRLVSELPEKYRLPIQLYYSAGLTVGAIAVMLNLPENTVKSRLHRARKIIRRKLEELEYDRTAI